MQPSNQADTLAWLDTTLRQFVHYVARHPEFMRLMNDEGKRDSKRMRWLADRFVRPMSQVVSAHLERAQVEGLMAPIPLVTLRYIVLGAAGLIFSQAPECKYIDGVDPTNPEFAERHAAALLQLLTAGGKRGRSVQSRRAKGPSKRRPQSRTRA